MSSFESPAVMLRTAPPDSRKHVNYTLGMVLGVDDFTQEFAYLSGRDQLLARELLGYGTVCGLRVTIEPADNPAERTSNPQVRVAPGLAVTPRGQLVGVSGAQCATLKSWLSAHAKEIEEYVGPAASTTLPVYLVLCYRDCLTDQVPIPGEPCRSEDEAFAAARVADDFKLELRLKPPEQREEDALRGFVEWLSQVPIAESPEGSLVDDTGFADQARWEPAIRDVASVLSVLPSSSPDFMIGAPPPDLRVRAEKACDFLRVAFRLWATELRPIVLGRGQSCAGDPPDEGCVLLAELSVPLVAGSLGGEVTIDEARRPYLLHLRLIQEWLLCGRREALPSDMVIAETEFGQEPSAGISEHYSRADHTHGSPALGGDVSGTAGDLLVERLRGIEVIYDADGPQPGQVLTFVQAGSTPAEGEGVAGGTWQAQDLPELAGDATGPLDNTSVERILGVDVRYPANMPQAGQVLTFMADGAGDRWEPAQPQSGVLPLGGDVTGTTDKNVVQRILGRQVIYDPQTPSDGQVLKFINGAWRPRPDETGAGAIQLKGDVTGQSDQNTIERLQNIQVDAAAPKPNQVLTYIEFAAGGRGVPADGAAGGNAVIHPAGLPAYAIVAAGAVPLNGSSDPAMYNGLKGVAVDNGRAVVSFDSYHLPDSKTFTYIVKALPVFDEKARQLLQNRMPTVAFENFTDQGLLLDVFIVDQPVDKGILSEMRLMIEISEYAIVS
jgi:hypothetical protein